MKIVKYKKTTKNRYKVLLDNAKELLLYEEVILKYNLLLKKEIDEQLLIEMDRYNQEWDVYYVALESIKHHFRSVYELKELLLRKEYPDEYIEKAIHKLLEQGYLNDQMYARSFINGQILTSNKGPYYIEKELLNKKISSDIIQKELEAFSEDIQSEKIKKMIERGIKSNRTRGGIVLKQKIYNELKNFGYDISLINSEISHYSFGNDDEIAKKEYEKLLRKYSRKYSGEELKRVVRQKMILKGLSYEK